MILYLWRLVRIIERYNSHKCLRNLRPNLAARWKGMAVSVKIKRQFSHACLCLRNPRHKHEVHWKGMVIKMEKKTDRRVRYTRMVIKQSFVKLLKIKPIAKITIKEICEEADINRATFYAHYKDQYDLLQQIENDIISDINQYLGIYNLRTANEVPIEMLDKVLEYIKENSEIFVVLLNYCGDTKFQQEITNIIGSQHFSLQAAKGDTAEYVYLFYANGSIGIILKWLKEGMKKPVNEITQLILDLSSKGIGAFKEYEDRE